MGRKRKRSTRRGKRGGKRRRFRRALRRIKHSVVKSGNPFRRVHTVRHRYQESSKSLNPGVGGTCAVHIFRANSMYDPDYTGTGHQPLGFDEMSTIYNKHKVTRAKITVTFQPSTNQYVGTVVGVAISRGNGGLSDAREYIENGSCVWKYMDADYTGTGHQPLGFDEMSTIYNKHKVTRAKITVTFQPSTNQYVGTVVGVAISRGNGGLSDAREYIENGSCVWKYMDAATTANGAVHSKTVSLGVDIKKFFGKSSLDDDFIGSSSDNPARVLYFHVFCGNLNSQDEGIVYFNAKIEFQATWTDPYDLVLS